MTPATTPSTTARAWRALGMFWAAVIVAVAATLLLLALLGPPDEMPENPPQATETPAPQAALPQPPAAAPDTRPPPAEAPPPEPPAAATRPAAASPQTPPVPATPVPQTIAPSASPRAGTPSPTAAPVPALPPPAPPMAGPINPPDPALLEPSRHGPLPRVGPDGRSPARLYARAFDRSLPGPRIAVLVGGVGMSVRLAREAIATLPPEVSLALVPYAPDMAPILAAARARGIETLMSLPFEPQGWPLNDTGDQALLTGLPMDQNLDRLFWALSRAQGQIGAVGALGPLRGERFANHAGALEAVQRILASRGLIYVEPRPGAPPPAFTWGLAVDLVIDEPNTAATIDARLAALEVRARDRGAAVGYAGHPSPVLVERIATWAAGLPERGIVLAPISAMIRRPDPR